MFRILLKTHFDAVFVLALVAVLASTHFSQQSAEELRLSIRTAVDERRFADALYGLDALEQKDVQAFRSGDFDYLAARLNERTGNSATAAARYLAVTKRGSILRPYALFHLAAIARTSGNLVLERVYLDEVAASYPSALVADAARNRRARSWLESGNYEMAAKAFESILPNAGKTAGKGEDAVTRENRLYLARSYMLSGKAAEARAIFTAIIGSASNPAQPDDASLAAAIALDKLDRTPGSPETAAPKLGDYEHLRRASIYQFNRDFPDARLHYAAIVADHPASGIMPDAIFQTGRGHAQEANFPEAVRWFERVIEQFPEHPLSRDALLQVASAYARVGKPHESVRRYQDFIAKYPGDERLDRAYLNIVDTLRDSGDEADARKWARTAQEVFAGKLPEALALFSEVRMDLARSNWDAGVAGIDKLLTMPNLGGAAVPGGTNKAEAAFLRAFALEQKRSFAEAIDAYLAIPDGRAEYYGWRATERLQALAKDRAAMPAAERKLASLAAESKDAETGRRSLQASLRLATDPAVRQKLLESLRKIYATLPAYRDVPSFKMVAVKGTVAEKLTSLGLYDEAAPEFEAAQVSPSPATGDRAYTAAVLHSRGDRAYRAVAFAEPAWRGVPADFQVELIPRGQVELLYPAPYRDFLIRHAEPRGVDPRFLLSIVRQESRYRADIKSYAAARGLMQFISTTSDKIAAELGRKDFGQDELYDPSTAILFGSQYAANLFKLFPNQPDAVAASYNGGEDNMRRWKNRSRSELPDLYVPEIVFSQSKDYVYKVMANYRIYRQFYNQDLTPAP